MSDSYLDYLREQEDAWENLCCRCGGCCGAFDDPCQHLRQEANGKYFCKIYATRFGLQVTLGGEEFKCVPIKEIMHNYWSKDYLCTCKAFLKKPCKI